MKYEEIRIDVMRELLEDMGIKVTREQAQQLASDFSNHIDMEGEMESYQHKGHVEKCEKCTSLEKEVKRLESDNRVYSENVRRRHGASHAYVDGGRVMYDMK